MDGESLDDLSIAADALDRAAPGGAPGAAVEVLDAAPPPGNAQILAGALAAGREAFCMFTQLESPRRHLSDDKVQQLGDVWAPVLDKHGIDLARYMSDWGVELAAALLTFQIVRELREGVKAEIAAREAAKPAQPEAGTDVTQG